jgi:hypothetical protein
MGRTCGLVDKPQGGLYAAAATVSADDMCHWKARGAYPGEHIGCVRSAANESVLFTLSLFNINNLLISVWQNRAKLGTIVVENATGTQLVVPSRQRLARRGEQRPSAPPGAARPGCGLPAEAGCPNLSTSTKYGLIHHTIHSRHAYSKKGRK